MLSEIAFLHKTILVSQGRKYLSFLKDFYLPGINTPTVMIEKFVQAIELMETKELRKWFNQFYNSK